MKAKKEKPKPQMPGRLYVIKADGYLQVVEHLDELEHGQSVGVYQLAHVKTLRVTKEFV